MDTQQTEVNMSTPQITTVDIVTTETTVRDMTAEEIADLETIRAQGEADLAAQQAAAAARESGRAKLKALGLTDEEVNALIP